MKRLFVVAVMVVASCTWTRAEDFTAAVKSLLHTSPAEALSVPGSDANWLFLRRELEHLAVGDLASANLAQVNKEGTDAIPVITKYAEELKALGVELLLVPVPAKASIYPEKLSATADPASVPTMTAFFAKLNAAGVEVLDLEAAFKAERAKYPERQLYCATDSHWSPYAAKLVAQVIAERFKTNPAVIANAMRDLIVLPEESLEFHGDLVTDVSKATVPKEKLPMQRAGLAVPPDGKSVTSVESDPQSPVLVLGDSHLQVFRRGGSMLATQGGLVDHLQVLLPAAVEEITMQAGGADGPRVEIARATVKNPDFWAKKKIAVWLFTAREFTQGKWRVLPAKVIKK